MLIVVNFEIERSFLRYFCQFTEQSFKLARMILTVFINFLPLLHRCILLSRYR